MEQEPDNIKISALWPTVVMQSTFVENIEGMKKEIYRLTGTPSSIKKSNYGGWQSDIQLHENGVFKPLCDAAGAICARVSRSRAQSFTRCGRASIKSTTRI